MFTFNRQTLEDIKKVNWTFPDSSSNGHITSLHTYPARFIPIIPRILIENLQVKHKITILDPFAGCGTTLYEGLSTGNDVIGIDVNGLAVLLQRVYTNNYSNRDFNDFKSFYNSLATDIKRIKGNYRAKFLGIPNIEHWFNESAIDILSYLITTIDQSRLTESVKDLARFSVSRVIVKISNQQSDIQYRARNKNNNDEVILSTILKSFKEVDKAFSASKTTLKGSSFVVRGDARDENAYSRIKSKVDLIITSPPYPNAYEYWLYHKYRMYWLDLDPLWSKSREIGARPFYSGSGKLDEFDFKSDMEKVFSNLNLVSHKD